MKLYNLETMPIDKKHYPPDWDEISLAVRTEAGWRCEWCGAGNKTVIKRLAAAYQQGQYQIDWAEYISVPNYTDGSVEETEGMSWRRLRYHGLTRIILTTAHLDRDSTNNQRENLAALCQRCHLRYDIRQHIVNRKFGRHHAKEQQLKMF